MPPDNRSDGDFVTEVCLLVEESANPLHERGGGGVCWHGSGPIGGRQDDGADLDSGALRNEAVCQRGGVRDICHDDLAQRRW